MRLHSQLAALLILTAAAPALAGDSSSAANFISGIYAPYAVASNAKPLPRETIYSKSMLALIARDAELAGGEVGYLNGDPLCSCQDYTAFEPDVSVSEYLGKATAKIDFMNGDHHTMLTLKLIREKEDWRVDDVIDENGSLRQALITSNKSVEKSRR